MNNKRFLIIFLTFIFSFLFAEADNLLNYIDQINGQLTYNPIRQILRIQKGHNVIVFKENSNQALINHKKLVSINGIKNKKGI